MRTHYLVFVLAFGAARCGSGAAQPEVRTVPLTRTVRIPVEVLSTVRAPENTATLAVSEAATDELPQGPQSFDLLPGGGFVISDPLRRRLVTYDDQGVFRSEQPLGFAANDVSIPEGGPVQVRQATTDEAFQVGARGELQPIDLSRASRSAETSLGQARLGPENRGVIQRSVARGGAPSELEVRYDGEDRRLISLQDLGTDREGNTYVALETTRGGDVIDVVKLIRRYAPTGALVAEIRGISIDYYVRPTTEFRLRDGVVYQLMPLRNEVLINVWNTNAPQ